MSATRAGLDPEFATKLELFEKKLADNGIEVILTWGYRSTRKQNELYARGRTVPGMILTNARGGFSWHNYGLGADYAFVVDGKVTWKGPWHVFGRIARQCGLEWGKRSGKSDARPHVQWTEGRTIADMRTLAEKKGAQ